MPQSRIVILSNHSLFAEGLASRLRQYPQHVDVRFVDPQQSDYLAQVQELQPAAIVIDSADVQQGQCCLLCDLLLSLLDVPIIRLDAQQNDIHLITSVQRSIDEVKEIIEIIAQS